MSTLIQVSADSSLKVGTTPITLGTIGRVLFQGTGNVLQQSSNLFWDNTNGRLGIGQSTPTARIHIQGSSALSANSSLVVFNSTPTEIFRIRDNGNVQIGALTDAGYKLDVNGTARVSGTITLTDSSAGIVGSAQGVSIGSAYWTSFVYGGSTVHRLASNAYGLNSYIGNNIAFGYNPTGSSPASAKIEIGAGTATAGTAPLKLRAGTNLTTPENGAFEFDGTNLYFTTGGVRKTINLI